MKPYIIAALFIGLSYVIPFWLIIQTFVRDESIMAKKIMVVRGPLYNDWSHLYFDGITDIYKIEKKEFICEIDSNEGVWKLTLILK